MTADPGSSDRSRAVRVALGSLACGVAIAATKLGAAVATGSVALLGDGLHSAIDVGATLLTLAAVRWAAKPPDPEHPYGHGRAENLAALAEAALMIAVAAGIAIEAIQRLRSGLVVKAPPVVLVVIAGVILIDASRVRFLRRAARRYASPALQADAMNFTGDIAESVAVFLGLGAARLGHPAGDPIAALVVCVVITAMAARIGRNAVQVLMDRHPPDISDQIAVAAGTVPGVAGVGDLRVRRSGANVYAEVTVNVGRTSSVERSHQITEAVEAAVAHAIPGTQTSVHVEPSREGEDLVARTFAAANRIGMADQIHNVLAIRHPEGTWLMLHAKVPPELPLGEGHAITDSLERELRSEIDGLSRVEIHLEPREPDSLRGAVVSAERDRLTADVRRIAHAHPPITRCHEVAVSQAGDDLHVVLHCEAASDTTIAAIHDASLELEAEIHRRHGDVRTVTVHFEPAPQ